MNGQNYNSTGWKCYSSPEYTSRTLCYTVQNISYPTQHVDSSLRLTYLEIIPVRIFTFFKRTMIYGNRQGPHP